MKIQTFMAASLLLASLFVTAGLRADEVTKWNQIMLVAEHVADVSPLAGGRIGAIVQTSVFDALNGIERRYQPIYVAASAPRGASRKAAVAKAAYTALVAIFPDQKPDFDTALAASLAQFASDVDEANNQSIERGLAWGQSVAQ